MNLKQARKKASVDKWLLVDDFLMYQQAWNAVPLWQRRKFFTRVVRLVDKQRWGIEVKKKS